MPNEVPRFRLTSVGLIPLLVVRGDEIDPLILRADAERFFRRYPTWGRYGVSGYAARDDLEVDMLCETRLERFPVVVIFETSDLARVGIEVVPTFRSPHMTLAHESLAELVERLQACEHRAMANPHHEREAEWR